VIKPSAYDMDDVQEFFEQDTYGDLLDLLVDLISGHYTLENLKLDINEYIRERDD
tara:strand:+ start:189 stop:353 length:165 start_codon:yes stop_codon:yes gene_type:complete